MKKGIDKRGRRNSTDICGIRQTKLSDLYHEIQCSRSERCSSADIQDTNQ